MSRANLDQDLRHARHREKAAENRERILKAASRLIRERGISGAGVDALTEAAGMTYGSLYGQFGSKERLVKEALEYAIAVSGKTIPSKLLRSTGISPVTFRPNTGISRVKAVRWQHWFARCRARAAGCEKSSRLDYGA